MKKYERQLQKMKSQRNLMIDEKKHLKLKKKLLQYLWKLVLDRLNLFIGTYSSLQWVNEEELE